MQNAMECRAAFCILQGSRRGRGWSKNFRLVTIARICNKRLASSSKPPMDHNSTSGPKKSRVSKRLVLGAWVSLLLAIPSLLQSQTATPETQPSAQQGGSPSVRQLRSFRKSRRRPPLRSPHRLLPRNLLLNQPLRHYRQNLRAPPNQRLPPFRHSFRPVQDPAHCQRLVRSQRL